VFSAVYRATWLVFHLSSRVPRLPFSELPRFSTPPRDFSCLLYEPVSSLNKAADSRPIPTAAPALGILSMPPQSIPEVCFFSFLVFPLINSSHFSFAFLFTLFSVWFAFFPLLSSPLFSSEHLLLTTPYLFCDPPRFPIWRWMCSPPPLQTCLLFDWGFPGNP